MKGKRLLLLAVVVVLGGCGDSAESDPAGVEAGSVTTTTIAVAQPAPAVTSTTAASPASSRCQTVVFAPSTVEVARDITAYGLPCNVAEDVVRKVGSPLGAEGPPQAEADGFACARTGVQIGHSFPVATYECKRGSERITFSRTTAG